MRVVTIGGATQDIFLCFSGSDTIQINKRNLKQTYLLFGSSEKIEIDDLVYTTGGGATNSAVSFKKLGFDVSCICKIANDEAGKFVLDDLQCNDINTESLIITDKYCTGRSFIINVPSGERTIFTFRGANANINKQDINFDLIDEIDLLYITSLSGNSSSILSSIVSRAHKNNVSIAINPGTSQLSAGVSTLKEVLPFVDTFILNSSEAKLFMMGLLESDKDYKKILQCMEENKICPITDNDTQATELLEEFIPYENIYLSIKNFFKAVLRMGTKTVVVTDGSSGVYVAMNNNILFYPSIKTDVVATVGAGDAFGSCFFAFKTLGFSIENALRYSMINSASVIKHIGAKTGLLTKDELEKQADSIAPLSNLQIFKL